MQSKDLYTPGPPPWTCDFCHEVISEMYVYPALDITLQLPYKGEVIQVTASAHGACFVCSTYIDQYKVQRLVLRAMRNTTMRHLTFEMRRDLLYAYFTKFMSRRLEGPCQYVKATKKSD